MAEQEKPIATSVATGSGIANVAQDRNPWVTGGEGNAERTSRPVSNYATTERRKKGRQIHEQGVPKARPDTQLQCQSSREDGMTGLHEEPRVSKSRGRPGRPNRFPTTPRRGSRDPAAAKSLGADPQVVKRVQRTPARGSPGRDQHHEQTPSKNSLM